MKKIKSLTRTIPFWFIMIILVCAPAYAKTSKNYSFSTQKKATSTKKTTSKKKKQTKKSKKSTTIKVAVVDNTKKNAAGTIRWARYCGMEPVFIHSSKVNVSKYDGLLIPGGGDVDPRLYKAKRDPHTYGTNMSRSKLQIAVIKKFANAGKPVLGLCGGCQTINVAFGGTLHQHIGWHTGKHRIRIAKSSWIHSIFGSAYNVVHYHHQCVNKLGDGLKATQWDVVTNKIEGIEHKTLPIYGVQWHPDQMGATGKRVGEKFKKICAKYKKK